MEGERPAHCLLGKVHRFLVYYKISLEASMNCMIHAMMKSYFFNYGRNLKKIYRLYGSNKKNLQVKYKNEYK